MKIHPYKGRVGTSIVILGLKRTKRENIGEEAHQRRMAGLVKAWQTSNSNGWKKAHGEKVRPGVKTPLKVKRQRLKLRETLALEAREIQDKLRRNANAMLDRLLDIALNSERDADALSAITAAFDRAYGKANQVNLNANIDANGKAPEVSATELETRVKEAIARIDGIVGGAAKKEPGKERPADVCQHDRDPDGSTVH